MVRVWFNHWFSTSYGLIELMKKDPVDRIYIIASNEQIDSVIQNACDEWYQEPFVDGEEYIQYCIEFCKAHKVDVFVPRRNMVNISKNIGCFTEIGVKVMVDDYAVISLLNDKAAAYDMFQECEGIYIPDYYIVKRADEFERAYKKLRKEHVQVCVKFVKDEGALSYRRIIENVNRFERLRIYPGAEIAYEVYLSTLQEVDEFDDLMVMPYLPGQEISVDCLQTNQGLIAIPRFKSKSRHENIIFDEKILKMTHAIMDKVKLKCPCNVQFKLKDDIPYLLEVNTRMSGGLQMSCMAEQVNIPNIALNKLLGRELDWEYEPVERVVSYIEMPQIIR